ncbi:sorting nexin [Anaeramoeba flamelloides]|uniref:Sorting nexin n=1 Tax=Anaeramoeba flamelloides TaxID=1746091 RepID=A0AAV7YRK6_9EUKA|nr:sorting nexin [Anaeramoeba flamelloides]
MSNQTKVETSPYTNYFQLEQQKYVYSLNNHKLQKEKTQNVHQQQQDTSLSLTNNNHRNNGNFEEFQKTLSSSFSISPSSSSSKSTTQSSESSSGLNSCSNSCLESTSSSEFTDSPTTNRKKEKAKAVLDPNKQQEVYDGYQIKNKIITKSKNKSESEIGNQCKDQKTFNNPNHQNVNNSKRNSTQKETKGSSNWKIQISSPETLWAGVSKFTIYKVYSMRINSEKVNGCDFDFSDHNPKNKNEPISKNKSININKNELKGKKKKQNVVKRRYSDFAWLRDNLVKDFPGVIVPSLPEKQIVSKFTNKILEMRRKKFETFLIKISYHSLLSLSRAFAMFLEKEIVNIFKIKLNRDQVSYGINRLHTNYLEYQYNPNQLENLPLRIKTWEILHPILKQLLIEITNFENIQEKITKRLKHFSISILELNQCQTSPHLKNCILFTFEQLNALQKTMQEENQISKFLIRESINDLLLNCSEISKNNNKRNVLDEEYQNSIKYEKKCLNKFQDFQNNKKKKKKKSSSNLHILKKEHQSSVKKKQLAHSKFQKVTSVFIDELNKMENKRANFIKDNLLGFSKKQFEINKHSSEIWESITKNLQNLNKNTTKQKFSMKKK